MDTKNKGIFSWEFLLPNVILFLVIAVGVNLTYTHYVTPRTDELMLERKLKMLQPGYSAADSMHERSVLLIIKDAEPKWEIVFFLWGVLTLAVKAAEAARERRLLHEDFIPTLQGERILPDSALDRYVDLKSRLEKEPGLRDRILPRCLLTALHRFHASSSIQDAAAAVKDASERAGDHLDSSLSLIRYIAWAIPAIGFVGTVRGIGDALSFAEEAINGNLSAVTSWLGLAFNSTLVGLMLCIFLMYLLHIVQSSQEALVTQVQTYCSDKLLDVMSVPSNEEGAANKESESAFRS